MHAQARTSFKQSSYNFFMALLIAVLVLAAMPVLPARAAVAALNAWPTTPQLTGTTGNLSGTYTISAGSHRLLVILVSCYNSAGTSGQTFAATYGGKLLTQAFVENSDRRQTWIGYLKESDIASRTGDAVAVTITGTHTNVVAYIGSYSNIDQAAPVTDADGRYINNSNNQTISATALNVNAGGYGIYGWSGTTNTTRTSDTETYTENSDVNNGPGGTFNYGVASKAIATTGTTNPSVTWSGNNRVSVAGITLNPVTTIVGDGSSPASKSVAAASTNNAVSAFTLATSFSGATDTVTGLVVTGSCTTNCQTQTASSGAKLWQDNGAVANEWDSNDTQIGTSVTFATNTATFTGLSIPVTNTAVQYLVTYDVAAGAATGVTLAGAVSGLTASNTVVNNDNTDATLTVRTSSTTAVSTSGTPSTYGNSVTFTATVTPAVATGTVNFYDGATLLGSGTLSSGTATYATAALKAVTSPHSITARYMGNSTYAISTSTAISQVVNQKVLTITGLTANNKTYDGGITATLSGTAALSGVVSGDTVTLGGTASATYADKTVANGKPVTVTGYTISGTDAGNYSLTQPSGLTANITALAITGRFTADNKVYDGTDSATIATRSLSGAISGDEVSYSGGAATFSDKNVGDGKTVTATGLGLSGADAGNYTVNTSATATANITALAITGSITANNKVYDGTTSATIATRTLSGDIASDDVNYAGGTATFGDKNVGDGKTVTATGLGLSGTDAGNYTVNSTATATANISKADADITITPYTVTYDGNAHTATGTALGVEGETLNGLDLSGTTHTNADTYASDAWAFTDVTGNYNDASDTVSDIIGKANADITVTPYTVTYDGDAHTATGSAKGTKGETLSGLDLSGTTHTNADTYASDAWVFIDATGNYNDASGAIADTISKAAADISVTPYSVTYDGDPHTATGSATGAKGEILSGLDLSGTTHTSAGNFTDGWTYTDSTGNYNDASGSVSDVIAKANAVITDDTYSGLYDGTSHGASLSAKGVKNEDLSSLFTIAPTTYTDVPGGNVSWSFAGDANYNATSGTAAVVISPVDLTVVTDNHNIKINTPLPVYTYQILGFVNGETESVLTSSPVCSAPGADNSKLGDYSISCSGGTATNYTFVQYVDGILSVVERDPTALSVTSVSGTYGGTVDLSATLTSGANPLAGVVVNFTINGNAAGSGITNASGVATVNTASLFGLDAGNYATGVEASFAGNATYAPINGSAGLSVDPASVTPVVTADNKTYDGTTDATIATRSLTGVLISDDVSLAGGSAAFDTKSVGAAKTVTVTGLSLDGAKKDNYVLSATTATTTAEISARALTVSAVAANKVYDGATTADVTLSTDKLLGDTVTPAFAAANFDTAHVGTGKTVTVSGLSISGADADNYSLSNNTATDAADITSLGLTGSVTAGNKVYDGSNSATIASYALLGQVPSDDVTYTGGTAHFSDKVVGNGKVVTVTGLTLSGSDAGNYTVNSSATTTANITALEITGSITADSKVYDGTTAATIATRTLSGEITGDAVAYTGGTATFSDPFVGTAKAVAATGLTLSGADAGNYTVNGTAATTADITKAALTVTPDDKSKAFGNIFTDFTGVITGAISGDNLTANYASDGALANALPGIYDISATLNDPLSRLGNYTVTINVGKLTVTAAATLNITGNVGTGKAVLSYDDGGPQTVTADASGNYTIVVPFNWTGTVTPSKFGYTFTPASVPYTGITADQTAQDYTATVVPQKLTLKSFGAQDGWVLESGEKTNLGGSLDAKSKTFQLGDDIKNRQYKGILSFNTATLPAGAIITSVQIRIKQSGAPVGISPFTALGKLMVDVKTGYFGLAVLQKTDFQAKPTFAKVGTFGKKAVASWYSVNLSAAAKTAINRKGYTQFRLYFSTDDNNNFIANYMKFFSGNNATGKPELIITYTMP